ncbi:MAG: hypothetical protein ABFC86_02770, partial [Rectinema sp.]
VEEADHIIRLKDGIIVEDRRIDEDRDDKLGFRPSVRATSPEATGTGLTGTKATGTEGSQA